MMKMISVEIQKKVRTKILIITLTVRMMMTRKIRKAKFTMTIHIGK